MKIHIWVDGPTGKTFSKTGTTDRLFGVTEEEWNALLEQEREELVKDVAFEQIHWGYNEITEEQE